MLTIIAQPRSSISPCPFPPIVNPPNRKTAHSPLAHTLYPPGSSSVCLLTKDPQREYKDLLSELGVKRVSRVVGVAKLKGKFKAYDARRQLLADHDVFLADDRITPLLPALLGKKFFDAKKQPILVDIRHHSNPTSGSSTSSTSGGDGAASASKKRVAANIDRALSSTYYHQNTGANAAVKIGHLRLHSAQQLLDNLRAVLPALVARVPAPAGASRKANKAKAQAKGGKKRALGKDGLPLAEGQDEEDDEDEEEEGGGGWANIQALELKTGASASLPIWNCNLSTDRWLGQPVVESEEMEMEVTFPEEGEEREVTSDEEEEEEDDEVEEKKEAVKEKARAKAKAPAKKAAAAVEASGEEKKKKGKPAAAPAAAAATPAPKKAKAPAQAKSAAAPAKKAKSSASKSASDAPKKQPKKTKA